MNKKSFLYCTTTHFLLQLNGHYEGGATGETFNASGKTDILIREDNKNVFIAECKFWRGQKGFMKAVNQLPFGLDRGNLDGVDGYFAVFLWRDYQQNNNEKALETLLAYNIEDAVNLETLMVMAYNLKIRNTLFHETNEISLPDIPEIPFQADLATIDRIKREMFRSSESYNY